MPFYTRRPVCPKCLRPHSACICRWITTIAHTVEVLILQHPAEVAQAKGSARLLHLSLPHSRLLVGEVFPEQELRALLHGRHTILLYPQDSAAAPAAAAQAPALDDTILKKPERLRLVVLDGTWRQSRQMIRANPLLQTLPRLTLNDAPASRYRIRKAHGAHQLSTLEAACYALMRLEHDDRQYAPLLDAFDGFVAQQLAYRKAGTAGRDHSSNSAGDYRDGDE